MPRGSAPRHNSTTGRTTNGCQCVVTGIEKQRLQSEKLSSNWKRALETRINTGGIDGKAPQYIISRPSIAVIIYI